MNGFNFPIKRDDNLVTRANVSATRNAMRAVLNTYATIPPIDDFHTGKPLYLFDERIGSSSLTARSAMGGS